MKTYPKYKESGIPWIGQIPEEWKVSYLLHVLRGNITDGPHETPRLVETGIPFISVDSLNDSENIDFAVVKKFISEIDYQEYCKKAILEEHDILFSKSATIGKTAIVSKEKFMVWSPLAIIKPQSSKINYKYLYYVISNNQYRKAVCLLATYNTQLNVGMRMLEKSQVPVPPLSEQQAIAEYLDKKTGDIDELVGLLNKQIADVRAYRQSLITETVTQGLNKDVPMKDSGIEWIGQIPEGWTVRKIKYLATLQSGNSLSANDIEPEGDYPVYGGNGIRGYYRDYSHNGDFVLIGRQGALCGNINYAHDKFWATEHAIVCTPLIDYQPFWFGELLRCMNLNQYSESAAQPGLSVGKISNLDIPVPPLDELYNIADFLCAKTKDIDELLSKLEAQVADLLAYKSSLISEVVTGKIDIR